LPREAEWLGEGKPGSSVSYSSGLRYPPLQKMALLRTQPSLLPTPEAVGDAELVARALGGDRWSRDVIYRRHAHYLLAIAIRLLSNRGEGEEVVQDTFLVGFQQLGRLREPAALRGWLARIAVSLVRRRLRRERLMRFLGLDGGDDDATLASLAGSALRPDDRAELALVDRVLRRIPADQRIAWMLRRVEGLPLAEVASACACSLATAKRRVAAADAEIARHVSLQEGSA
jgi:RNA polymerase sigma-70 factor, ECF subfamily